MSLAEQVKAAQRAIASWPKEKREAVQLEGGVIDPQAYRCAYPRCLTEGCNKQCGSADIAGVSGTDCEPFSQKSPLPDEGIKENDQ